jgi:equilibrative nucleoside transporter 1/2/3
MPVYKIVAASLESKSKNEDDPVQEDGRRELITRKPATLHSIKGDVIRVAKINIVYEVAVAVVFFVTLVLSY